MKLQILCAGWSTGAGVADSLGQLEGLRHWQLNLVDTDVAAAAKRRIGEAGYQAVVSIWLDQAVVSPARLWLQLQPLLAEHSPQLDAYLVEEAVPLPNPQQRASGERQPGFTQLALLRCPAAMRYGDWLAHWKHTHTQIAIDTQSTYSYVQNRVLAVLSEGSPLLDAIVEESFPAAAMANDQAFYDAQGDEARFQRHVQAMMDSCSAFIDFERLEVIPSSEYRFAVS